MATGMEMLLQSVFRLAKIDPEELKGKAVEMQHTVIEIATLLRAIYRQNAIMMQHMGLKDDGRDIDDGSIRIVAGRSECGNTAIAIAQDANSGT